jgi:multidrug transporter EmrE-like cation transporter
MNSVKLYSFIGSLFNYGSDIFSGKIESDISLLDRNLLKFVYLGFFSLIYLLFISKTPLLPTLTNFTSNKNYLYILLTALGMGIGNTILINTLNKFNTATVMSYFESFGIIIGTIIGYLFFKESISSNNLIALALIIFGVFLYKD